MDEADVLAHLRAGAALYTAGHYHAAHDPWEAAWLATRGDPADAALFQGLVQTTAALFHAHEGNTEGASGLAASAREYLGSVPAGHRGVDRSPFDAFLTRLEADPVPRDPPPLRVEGRRYRLADLEFPAAAVAAAPLAEAEGFDPDTCERAAEYARADLADSPTSRFVDALLAFVSAGASRAVAYDRLARRVERRDAELDDVSGLF